MEIVEHLRLPADVGIQHIFGELECHAHGVAIVVVRDVLAPVDQRRIEILWVRKMPSVNIDHAVAAIHFHYRCDQRDHAVADFANVWTFIHGEAVGQFHQRGGSAGFRGMDCSRDVVNRYGLRDELVGFSIIQLDRSRIGQLREPRAIFFEVLQVLGRGDGHGDHLAPFFRRADRKNLHAGAGLFQHAHVLVHILGVGQHAGRTGYVAQHSFGSRHGFGRGKIIDEWRGEIRCRSVFLNFGRVGLVYRLLRIARRNCFVICRSSAHDRK